MELWVPALLVILQVSVYRFYCLILYPKEAVEAVQNLLIRNKIVNDALAAAIKSNPSPVYHKDVIKKITTGNFDDNMKEIADCDWVIEVVVERLDIKQTGV